MLGINAKITITIIAIPVVAYSLHRLFQHPKSTLSDRDSVVNLDPGEEFQGMFDNVRFVTFYERLELQDILDKTQEVLNANPWLASIYRKVNRKLQLHYNRVNKASDYVRYIESDIKVSEGTVELLLRYCRLPKGCNSVNKDIPLFEVIVVKLKDKTALIFDMSHIVGDAQTLYMIYRMYDSNSHPYSMQIERVNIKDKLNNFSKEVPNMMLLVYNSLFPTTNKTRTFKVLKDRMEAEKILQKTADTEFLSTNDILTSWAFNASKCDIGVMPINLRGRVAGVHDSLAGNYVHGIFYSKNDFQTPQNIRGSLPRKDGIYQRMGDRPLPQSLWEVFTTKVGSVTNWVAPQRDVVINGNISVFHAPLLNPTIPMTGHFTIYKSNNEIYIRCCSKYLEEIPHYLSELQ